MTFMRMIREVKKTPQSSLSATAADKVISLLTDLQLHLSIHTYFPGNNDIEHVASNMDQHPGLQSQARNDLAISSRLLRAYDTPQLQYWIPKSYRTRLIQDLKGLIRNY